MTSTLRLTTTVPASPVTHAVISTRPGPTGFHRGMALSPGTGSLPGVAAQWYVRWPAVSGYSTRRTMTSPTRAFSHAHAMA